MWDYQHVRNQPPRKKILGINQGQKWIEHPSIVKSQLAELIAGLGLSLTKSAGDIFFSWRHVSKQQLQEIFSTDGGMSYPNLQVDGLLGPKLPSQRGNLVKRWNPSHKQLRSFQLWHWNCFEEVVENPGIFSLPLQHEGWWFLMAKKQLSSYNLVCHHRLAQWWALTRCIAAYNSNILKSTSNIFQLPSVLGRAIIARNAPGIIGPLLQDSAPLSMMISSLAS